MSPFAITSNELFKRRSGIGKCAKSRATAVNRIDSRRSGRFNRFNIDYITCIAQVFGRINVVYATN